MADDYPLGPEEWTDDMVLVPYVPPPPTAADLARRDQQDRIIATATVLSTQPYPHGAGKVVRGTSTLYRLPEGTRNPDPTINRRTVRWAISRQTTGRPWYYWFATLDSAVEWATCDGHDVALLEG